MHITCDLIQLLICVGRRDRRPARSLDSETFRITCANRCPTILKSCELKDRWSWTENMLCRWEENKEAICSQSMLRLLYTRKHRHFNYLSCELIETSWVQLTDKMTFQGVAVHPKLLCELVNYRWPVIIGDTCFDSCSVIITILSSEHWVGRLGWQRTYREGQGTSKELQKKVHRFKGRAWL